MHQRFADSFTKIHTFFRISRLCLPHNQCFQFQLNVYRFYRYIFLNLFFCHTRCPVISILVLLFLIDESSLAGYISTMQRANKLSESRAASSNNWRLPVKPEETQGEQPSDGQPNRPAIESEPVPAAFTEGRRLYVGNLLYMARLEDVESLFSGDEYKV